jgi:signal transduction histidine kinase
VANQADPETISALLALLAHDMRNPLSALQSNVSYVASFFGDSAEQDVREALEDTAACCDGMSHIIDNLEVLSQALAGSSNWERVPVPIAQLLADAVARNQAVAKSHDVRIELEVPGEREHGLCVLANRQMLARALQNLLRNSIQYSCGGEPVRVSFRLSEGWCEIVIRDAGPSLAPEHRDVAFTPQGQLRAKGLSGGRYGRGLGLLSARICAEAAGASASAGDNDVGCTWILRAEVAR